MGGNGRKDREKFANNAIGPSWTGRANIFICIYIYLHPSMQISLPLYLHLWAFSHFPLVPLMRNLRSSRRPSVSISNSSNSRRGKAGRGCGGWGIANKDRESMQRWQIRPTAASSGRTLRGIHLFIDFSTLPLSLSLSLSVYSSFMQINHSSFSSSSMHTRGCDKYGPERERKREREREGGGVGVLLFLCAKISRKCAETTEGRPHMFL